MIDFDVLVEVVEVDPNNRYYILEGPGKNGKLKVKVEDTFPPGMEVGEDIYVPITTWIEWCTLASPYTLSI